jgi:hypothetical protein
VITLFPVRLGSQLQEWWYSKQPSSLEQANCLPPPVMANKKAGAAAPAERGAGA